MDADYMLCFFVKCGSRRRRRPPSRRFNPARTRIRSRPTHVMQCRTGTFLSLQARSGRQVRQHPVGVRILCGSSTVPGRPAVPAPRYAQSGAGRKVHLSIPGAGTGEQELDGTGIRHRSGVLTTHSWAGTVPASPNRTTDLFCPDTSQKEGFL